MWYPLWSNGDELLCIVDVQNDDHDGWAQEFQVVQSSPTFRGFARRDISRQNHSQPWKMVATTTLVTEAEKPFNIPQIAYFEEEATVRLKITKKVSDSTLRAKRATFTFWVDKS